MGFFDKDVTNGFDEIFDFDRDGVLDPCEQAMQIDYIERADREARGKGNWNDTLYSAEIDDDDDNEDDFDSDDMDIDSDDF